MAAYIVTTLIDELDAADTNPSTFNPNDLSLREALALANNDPGTLDTITFDQNLTGGTTPGVDDGVVTLGGTELLITGNVTVDGDVDGNGTADITVSAAGASRVINIDGATPIYAVLNGLVIADGVTAGTGGGISLGALDTLTLTNSTVQNNVADTAGGGLASGGTASLSNVTLTNNDGGAGADGGGIYNSGLLLADRLTLTGSDTGAFGGALMNSGIAVLTNSTLSANTAGGSGGGIYNLGSLTLYNTTLSENYTGVDGGGIR